MQKYSLYCFRIVFIGFSLFLMNCTSDPKPRQPTAVLDNPTHHVLKAKDLIQKNQWEKARREFRLALELNPAHSPALGGQALIKAHDSSRSQNTEEQKSNLGEEATRLLDQALNNAKNPQEQVAAHLMGIRVHYWLASENWLEESEDHFNDAITLHKKNSRLFRYESELWYYMGRTYTKALDIEKAVAAYRTILELNAGWLQQADDALKLLNKIQRAEPGSRQGKIIALIPEISRGDMAALLVEELNLSQLFKRQTDATLNNRFQAPTSPDNYSTRQVQTLSAMDIETHPLRTDIEEVLALEIRGLEADSRKLFYPNQKITRAEFAIMMEDILIQITQNPKLSTRFFGESSPFTDVRNDAYYYNAARIMVSRNIMQLQDQIRGLFAPNASVHGADALLALRVMKTELSSYFRSPQS